MKKILLLDGYNLIYRARYSGMNKGENSTIFNFFRGIRPLIEKFDPDLTYFVLEGKPKKRLELCPDYKGQREYNDNDGFNRQRKEIIKLLKSNIPFVIAKHNDYECDDIINFLAVDKHKEDDVTIISSDTDFIQSISESVKLYNPVRKKFIDSTPYSYVLWKSLVGDKSDNIQGFKGIGDKKAKKLLSDDNMFKDFLLEENNKKIFERNKFMIKFHDLDLKEKDEIQYFKLKSKPNWEDLKNTFKAYEFNSIVDKDKTWNKYINTFKNLERYNNGQ